MKMICAVCAKSVESANKPHIHAVKSYNALDEAIGIIIGFVSACEDKSETRQMTMIIHAKDFLGKEIANE